MKRIELNKTIELLEKRNQNLKEELQSVNKSFISQKRNDIDNQKKTQALSLEKKNHKIEDLEKEADLKKMSYTTIQDH